MIFIIPLRNIIRDINIVNPEFAIKIISRVFKRRFYVFQVKDFFFFDQVIGDFNPEIPVFRMLFIFFWTHG